MGGQIPGRVQSSLLDRVFPPQCLLCGDLVQAGGGLCGPCWRDTPFILGLCCDQCGSPLMGEESHMAVRCDECREMARPWARGRSVMVYDDGARRIVLGLKHGDRLDLVPSLARWMAVRAGPVLRDGAIVVPVPVHWRRLLKRRYNQAAVLANALARETGARVVPDLLVRRRKTAVQDGMGIEARFANVSGAFGVHPRRRHWLQGRDILLVDDVMTSGATLAGCAETCLQGGAARVDVMTLARVVRDA